MKYPCEVIRDLLPLYIDDVCSETSREIVEGHIEECSECRFYAEKMKASSEIPPVKYEGEEDIKMADSLKKVKKTIRIKRALTGTLAAVAMIAVIVGIIYKMQYTYNVVEYDNNISVSQFVPEQFKSVMGDDYLTAQVIGNNIISSTQKRVDLHKDGEMETIIYFCSFATLWDELMSNENTISYHLLSPLNEHNDIDRVYYYTGSYNGLENMTEEELEQINKESVLLWSKE